MRCRHCGAKSSKEETIPPFRASCPRCAKIAPPALVEQQGDGVTGFREIMIRQNINEAGRKLLETESYHFVVFLDDDGSIVGFDLVDRDIEHLFEWRRGKSPKFYGVTNVGKGYHNRDEVYLNDRFDPKKVLAELKQRGGNIRTDVRTVLIEGINSYR